MARSDYFIINSQFKPFSYNEMLAPVQMANQEFYNVQEQLGQLDTQASVWEGLINKEVDPEAYDQYSAYSNALRDEANSLVQKGLTPASRRSLSRMRARYSSDIVPLEQAYSRRQALQDEQRKALLQNPSLIYDRDASTIRLKELMDNPTLQPRSISGALLTQQVAQQVAPLAKQIIDDIRQGGDKANEWKSILGDQYYEKVYRTGFDSADIQAAMMGQGPKVLVDSVQNAIRSSGVPEWNDEEALSRAYQYANQGLYSAIGQTDYKNLQNRNWDLNADLAKLRLKSSSENPSSTYPNPIQVAQVGSSPADLEKQQQITKGLELLSNLNEITDTNGNITLDFNIDEGKQKQIDTLQKDIQKLQETLDYQEKAGKDTFVTINDLSKKQKQLEDLGANADKIIGDAYKDYSYLFPDNPKKAIEVGLKLDYVNSQEQAQYNYVPIESKDNMNQFMSTISTLIQNSEGTPKLRKLEHDNKGKLSITEKTVSKEDALKLLNDDKLQKSYSYPQGEGGVVSLTSKDGTTEFYRVEGVPSIANTNNILKKTQDFLTNFKGSKNTVNKIADITNQDDLSVLYDKYSHPISDKVPNVRGTTITAPNGDIQKVVMIDTGQGIQVYNSSLYDFVYDSRRQYNNTLQNFVQSPHVRQFTEFQPAKYQRETIKY